MMEMAQERSCSTEALLDISDARPRDIFLDGVELRVVGDETATVELNDGVLYVFR
jgi:hypothetical protein